MPLEKEGLRGDATCMVAQIDHGELVFIGKTNQHGRIKYGALTVSWKLSVISAI
jgi:hypothetical protein